MKQDRYGECEMQNGMDWLMQLVLFGLNGIVLLVGSTWAWETRKVYFPGLNDSVQVSYILMLVFVVTAFLIGMDEVTKDNTTNPEMRFLTFFFAMTLVAWVSL